MNIISALSISLYVATAGRLSLADDGGNFCTRGDGQPGKCIDIRECQKIDDLYHLIIRKQGTPADQQYMRNSRCPVYKANHVCCEEEVSEEVKILLEQDCGYIGPSQKVLFGNEIKLMSRPWMALLKLKQNSNVEYACGGTLITNRFVLTAAHCFDGQELLEVRLGEHRISTEQDCDDIGNTRICAPPVRDISFDNIFVHENYSRDPAENDIALIKLSTDVESSLSIRPICLPVNYTLQQEAEHHEIFRVTGWGATERSNHSDVPKETGVDRQNHSLCQNVYGQSMKSSQICAGSFQKDSCKGDSGGPLFYPTVYNGVQRMVQFGIVSYGSSSCGDGKPGVYTNVASFIRWIADKLIAN
ncbi:serine protease grass-like [Drosophila grimshawi]|uniref:serine protease grass-like n=1 Tax=Drosophila grimshawi TaxID=7222 RepID=UPI001C935175|nr:serine protease grass-like [Drosophila grimshawi]